MSYRETMKTSYLGNLSRGNSAWKSIRGCCHSPISQALPILSCVLFLCVPLPMDHGMGYFTVAQSRGHCLMNPFTVRRVRMWCCGLGPMQHGLSYSRLVVVLGRAASSNRMHVLHHPLEEHAQPAVLE